MLPQNNGLAFGLNITKKKQIGPARPLDGLAGAGPGGPAGRKTSLLLPQRRAPASAAVLGDGDDDIGAAGDVAPLSDRERARAEIRAAQLRSEERTRAEQAKLEAQGVDPTIFDYDAAYDGVKAAEREEKRRRGAIEEEKDKGRKKPRYMENLLRAAEQRKVDLLQATERKIQREREAEGDEFGDTEKFVTSAYKRTVEEMRKAEEEERKKAASEDVTRKSDLTGFYRTMLNETTRGAPVMAAGAGASAGAGAGVAGAAKQPAAPTAEDRPARAALPAGVVVNDSDEIVDKRQLLSGGLNVLGKSKTAAQLDREDREEIARIERERREKEREKERERRAREEARARRREEAERTARYVEEERRRIEEETRAQKKKEAVETKERAAKRTTDEAAEEARRRFLERKKAGAAAAAALMEESDED